MQLSSLSERTYADLTKLLSPETRDTTRAYFVFRVQTEAARWTVSGGKRSEQHFASRAKLCHCGVRRGVNLSLLGAGGTTSIHLHLHLPEAQAQQHIQR